MGLGIGIGDSISSNTVFVLVLACSLLLVQSSLLERKDGIGDVVAPDLDLVLGTPLRDLGKYSCACYRLTWSLAHRCFPAFMYNMIAHVCACVYACIKHGGHSAQGLRYCRVQALPNQPYMTPNNISLSVCISARTPVSLYARARASSADNENACSWSSKAHSK